MTTLGASKMWEDLHEAAAQASRESSSRGAEERGRRADLRAHRLRGRPGHLRRRRRDLPGNLRVADGSDTQKVRQLPDLTGMKKEVIIQKVHRNGYDHAVRSTGVRIVEVESEQRADRCDRRSDGDDVFLGGTSGDWRWETPVSLERCREITGRAGVPLMVDAANMLPPWENLRRLASLQVDLICISGGKHMRGPQCSGILAGRRDLIQSAWLNSSPHSDSLGRPMKVGREEMVMAWLTAEKCRGWTSMPSIASASNRPRPGDGICRVPGLKLERTPVDRTRKIRRVRVQWDEQALGITARDVERLLMEESAHCHRTSPAPGYRADRVHERSGRRKGGRQAAQGDFQGLG